MITEEMITEDYVSFETAKLLKEKGFNEIVDHCYDLYSFEFIPHCAKHGGQVNAPTLQIAMKWLWEVHKLVIDIEFQIDFPTWKWRIYHIEPSEDKHTNFKHYNTYEEACEAGIKYCIENLI